MIDAQFLEGLARFNLVINKRVTSNLSGPRKSLAVGRGMIFKDHRMYVPGDDFRAIDWKVYGRTDDLMIKNFEEERNLVVHIIIDKSLSMKYRKKFDYASMLGVGFAYLAMKNNDKFQFATFSDDLDVYQPKRGVSQVISMIDYLNDLKLKGKTNILNMAQRYKRFIGSRAMVILISDYLMPIEEIKEALYYFADDELTVVQVLDEKEKNPSMEGDFKLLDSEIDSSMRTYISPKLRAEYGDRLNKHIESVRHECNVLGAKFGVVTSDIPIFDAFYELLR
jgi:uncharacterized protein (DUF58 family)